MSYKQNPRSDDLSSLLQIQKYGQQVNKVPTGSYLPGKAGYGMGQGVTGYSRPQQKMDQKAIEAEDRRLRGLRRLEQLFNQKNNTNRLDALNAIRDLPVRQRKLPEYIDEPFQEEAPRRGQKRLSDVLYGSDLKDHEIAEMIREKVNPEFGKQNMATDGHCAECSSKTHHGLKRGNFNPANLPGSDENTNFNQNFFENMFSKRLYDNENNDFKRTHLQSNKGEKFRDFRTRVTDEIGKTLEPRGAVPITIGEGSHWINAYNDNGNIRYIDGQTGKGFNLYDDIYNSDTSLGPYETIDFFNMNHPDAIVNYFDKQKR